MSKTLLFTTIAITALSLLATNLAPSVLARDPLQGGLVTNYQEEVFNPAIATQDVNLQSTTYEMFLSLVSSMLKSTFITEDELHLRPGGTSGEAPSPTRFAGTIPTFLQLNAHLATNPPISTAQYLADAGSRLHLIPPVYAQGLGPTGLAPVLAIWRGFRNIAYFLATIGFVLLSFAIMFRVRLSPQTVVTAQTALSKLVIVFLAITFSYALAGLVVDLIFIVTFLIITLFNAAGLIGESPTVVQQRLLSGNPINLLGSLLGTVGASGDYLSGLINDLINNTMSGAFAAALRFIFSGPFDAIGTLIIGIAIIFSLFRLFIQLLLAYIEIIILTILGPIMILADVLPGGHGLSSWLKQLFANAMAFPTTTFMFLLGILLVGGNDAFGVSGTGINLEQGIQLPFLNFSPELMRGFLGIGIILMTPQAVKMVKDALKAESFFGKYTPAIGAALGVGAARGISTPWQQATTGFRLQKQAAQKAHAEWRASGGKEGRKMGFMKRQFGI